MSDAGAGSDDRRIPTPTRGFGVLRDPREQLGAAHEKFLLESAPISCRADS